MTRNRQAQGLEDAETRSLPIFTAGEVEVLYTIAGMGGIVAQNTVWEPYAHPTHELLWNAGGYRSSTRGLQGRRAS